MVRSTSTAYAITLLILAYTMNFVDRQLVTIVLNDVRSDLHLSDTQLGLVSGSGFAFFYAIAGIPLGYLADRRHRVGLLALSITLWSAMTAICGAAGNFVQLLLARMGVAIGEAGGTPAALSLIGDMYPPQVRASRLGLYFSGAALATMISYAAGGVVNVHLGWRLTFAVFAVPGVIIGLLLYFTVAEPKRGAYADPKDLAQDFSLPSAIATLLKTPVFLTLCLGYIGSNLVLYTVLTWGPSMAMRSYHLNSGEIGLSMGLSSGIAAGASHILGGMAADRLFKRGKSTVLIFVCLTQIVCGALVLAFLKASTFAGFATAFALTYAIGAVYASPSIAVMQAVLPVNLRATGAAALLLLGSVGGLGLGPLIIGRISDGLRASYGEASLQHAMYVLVPFAGLTAAIYLFAAWQVRSSQSYRQQGA